MKTKHHSILSVPRIQSGGLIVLADLEETKYRPTLFAGCQSSHPILDRTSPIRGSRLAVGLCGVLFTSLLALSPSLLKAECRSWDTSGNWFLKGGGDNWALHLTDKAGYVTGSATLGSALSKVTGSVTGNGFYLRLTSKPLELRADIGADGIIRGVLHDASNPDKKWLWTSSRAMKCADQLASPPTPQKPVETAPAATAGPKISASPTVVTIPDGQSQGTTMLKWDGGSDHPYAEVWVAVDGRDPTFLVEQGKGSRRVTVEPGKTYRYILTDSGKDLSTVTVRGK